MDGITDAATRYITEQVFLKYKGQDDEFQTWTEFMTADGFVINPKGVVKHLLTISSTGKKPIVQLFGGRKEYLFKASEYLLKYYSDTFSGIELNMGCPSNTVMKCGGGSDMMRRRKESSSIIKELSTFIRQGGLSFSIKTRAGLDDLDKEKQLIFLTEVSPYLDFLTIHGRTLKQLYAGVADFLFMKKVKIHAGCPVIANGGIATYSDAKVVASMGFDGVMIGQGSIGNPWVFSDHSPSIQEKKEILLKHLKLKIICDLYFKNQVEIMDGCVFKMPDINEVEKLSSTIDKDYPYYVVVEFRKYLFQYVKGIQDARELKQSFMKAKTYGEIEKYLDFLCER